MKYLYQFKYFREFLNKILGKGNIYSNMLNFNNEFHCGFWAHGEYSKDEVKNYVHNIWNIVAN